MHITHSFDHSYAVPVMSAVRVMAITGSNQDPLVERLGALGGLVEVETELYAALSQVIDDPSGYALVVVDCDKIGGPEAGEIAMRTLRAVNARVALILISGAHVVQDFPEVRDEAIRLRAPLSGVSLRVGFEHALRDRMIWQAA